MEDEKEVLAFVAQIRLGDLANGDLYVPAHVRRYCAKNPNQVVGMLLPSSVEEFVAATSAGLPLKEQLARFEKTVIRRNLARGLGPKATAADLGISRVTLWAKIRKWGWRRSKRK